MTSKIVRALVALTFAAAGVAHAQETTVEQHVGPAGGLHTTRTTVTPNGVNQVHRIDRPDGTTHIVHHQENANGDFRTVRHQVGSHSYHACHTKYHSHGGRYVHCTTHHH